MESGFKVFLNRPFNMDTIDLLVAEYRGREQYIAKPVELIFEPSEDGTYRQPTFRFDRWIAQPLLEAFSEMLHKEKIKPKDAGFSEGELHAIRSHLADMRRLVFKKP